MTQINLLPWREQTRLTKKIRLSVLFATFIIIAIVGVIISHLFITHLISRQEKANTYLQTQLDQEKATIFKLNKQKKERLLVFSQLIEAYSLQDQNFKIVSLLNILANNIPDGVNLTKIQKADSQITIEGQAQSNLEVTAFMKNLEKTNQFNQPVLTKISDVEQSASNTGNKLPPTKGFQIEVTQKR